MRVRRRRGVAARLVTTLQQLCERERRLVVVHVQEAGVGKRARLAAVRAREPGADVARLGRRRRGRPDLAAGAAARPPDERTEVGAVPPILHYNSDGGEGATRGAGKIKDDTWGLLVRGAK